MVDSVQFSDVQLLNLSLLMTMQANLRKDPVAACYKFGLTAEQAPKIANLTPEKMHVLVANLGHECLCMPRDDLLQLLESPPGLLGSLVTVRAVCQNIVRSAPVDRRITKKS